MYKICIIGDIHDWHSINIKNELEKNNCKVYFFSFSDLKMSLEKSDQLIRFKNRILRFHGIWVRYISKGTMEEITLKLTLLHILKDSGVYVHNTADTIEKTVDKSRTSGILKIFNLNTPKTWVFSKKDNFLEEQIFSKNKTIIYKPLFGSQGKGIKILNNRDDLKKITSNNGVYYLQKFIGDIHSKEFCDLRVLVSNHKIVSSIKRSSKNFITNAFQGSKIEKVVIGKTIKKISVNISKIFKLGYAGIDLKLFKKKVFVLEVNSIPSWKALQSVETKNITKILVNDFLLALKKKKIKNVEKQTK